LHYISHTWQKHGKLLCKLLALIVLLCFVSVSLLTVVFIVLHTDHDCIGELCSVCPLIHQTRKLSGLFRKAAPITFYLSAGLIITAIVQFVLFRIFNLVDIKARMNN